MKAKEKTHDKIEGTTEKIIGEKVEEKFDLVPDEFSNESFHEFVHKIVKSRFKMQDDFILKIPERFEKEFIINRVIGIQKNMEPKCTWEILSVDPDLFLPNAGLGWLSRKLETSEKSAITLSQRLVAEKTKQRGIDTLKDQIVKINDSITQLQEENLKLKKILYDIVITTDNKEKVQYLPIDIYLDTNDSQDIFSVYESIKQFNEVIGFENSFDFKAISGSWYKRFIARSKQLITDDEVISRLKEAEYGFEVNGILKQQSEIDKNQSEALLNILNSVERIPNAAIRIGSLIIVKITDKVTGDANVQVRSLSILEMHTLNKNPELLQNPRKILSTLAKEISKNKEISNN